MKRILVATDLSPCSTNTIARAIRLAAVTQAEIRIVHAHRDAASAADPDDLHRRIETEARIMAEELTDVALVISARVVEATPAEAILRAAETFDADLVLIGAHGEPRLRDAIFGTTGSHVVRKTERPVLIVQNDAVEPYGRVLAAIDGAETGPAILSMVRAIAPEGELFAVHAFYPAPGDTLARRAELDRWMSGEQLALEKLIGAFGAKGSQPQPLVRQHAVVEPGDALAVIMDETERLLPDLVAMGRRRKASFFGSHAVDAQFWCPSDLLVVPTRAAVPAAKESQEA